MKRGPWLAAIFIACFVVGEVFMSIRARRLREEELGSAMCAHALRGAQESDGVAARSDH